ncbi:SHOCT domain-containing protein [Emticicia sp. C21]|nr:SHOCT domain-containing protein [Emticicia sp. C21]
MDKPGDTYKMCDSLGLIITMNNTEKTQYKLLFITKATQENSAAYHKAYELFNVWHKLFVHHAIEKEETDTITHSSTTINITADASATPQVAQLVSSILAQHQTPPVADEILKLKNLLDQGALTQEEFDTQKAKVLNG